MTDQTLGTDLTTAIGELVPADVIALLAALAEHLGEPGVLDDALKLDATSAMLPGGGWTPEQDAEGRALACELLARIGPAAPPAAPTERRRMIEWLASSELDDDLAEMMGEELGLDGDARAPKWHVDEGDPKRTRTVAVIGAGMSGILAAHRLRQAGVEVTVIEKNDDVGGTWFENIYPGCRVDVPNHVYAYSNAQRSDWPNYHSPQNVLLDYFRTCADEWGVRPLVRFGTEVDSMRWDEEADEWVLSVHDASGRSDIRVGAVVSAVGQLNQPNLPDIEGRNSFEGRSFHTARWPTGVDLSGLRVGVVGTGASAMQAVPEIAPTAGHVTIFQRTPAWLLPRPEYHAPLPDGLLSLFEAVPCFVHWFRLRRFFEIHHGVVDAMRRDPDWDGPLERSVGPDNELMRLVFAAYIEEQFTDRPDLLERVMPHYPVGAKRVILDNGIWPETLKRDNVTLVTDPIDEIVSNGIVAGGETHAFDVIIYGTGFQASKFLTPMHVTGRGGADLHDLWGDDARAYLGMTVPGFPNFFCLYGPNTNIVINGSIIFFSECSVRYIVEAIHQLADDGLQAMDLDPAVHDAQVAVVDAANAEMAWGLSTVNSWYKSPTGRVAQNWPFPLVDYWRRSMAPDPAEYERW